MNLYATPDLVACRDHIAQQISEIDLLKTNRPRG